MCSRCVSNSDGEGPLHGPDPITVAALFRYPPVHHLTSSAPQCDVTFSDTPEDATTGIDGCQVGYTEQWYHADGTTA